MNKYYDEIIKKALEEDIQSGDITTNAIVSSSLRSQGEFLVKDEGIIAGLDIVEKLFSLFDDELKLKKIFVDGNKVKSGQIVAAVYGRAASILTTERTALNFLQRMSGIATMANEFAEKIKHTKAKILDTRKTAPGLRALDKLAVKIGGCLNHRFGLYDMFLIKDNHIAVAGSISKAVNLCKEFRMKYNLNSKIEVETTNLEEVNEALKCDVDFILLDNFELNEMRRAVKLIGGKCKTEASGRVDSESIVPIAESGVDFISIGALTHSVKALDISLEIKL